MPKGGRPTINKFAMTLVLLKIITNSLQQHVVTNNLLLLQFIGWMGNLSPPRIHRRGDDKETLLMDCSEVGRSVDDDDAGAVAAESVGDACLLAKMMTLLLWYMRFLSWLVWLVAWIWHIKNFQSLSLGRIVILGQYYCCLLTCSLAVVLVIQPCNAFLL